MAPAAAGAVDGPSGISHPEDENDHPGRRRPVQEAVVAWLHGTALAGGLDIDTVWINGYGFPPNRGGPMFYADTIGLSKIYGTLQHFAVSFGSIWNRSALLEKLAKANQTFASLDAGKA